MQLAFPDTTVSWSPGRLADASAVTLWDKGVGFHCQVPQTPSPRSSPLGWCPIYPTKGGREWVKMSGSGARQAWLPTALRQYPPVAAIFSLYTLRKLRLGPAQGFSQNRSALQLLSTSFLSLLPSYFEIFSYIVVELSELMHIKCLGYITCWYLISLAQSTFMCAHTSVCIY